MQSASAGNTALSAGSPQLDLAQFAAWDLARIALASLLLLVSRAWWGALHLIGQVARWFAYRRDLEDMTELNNHMRDDIGIARRPPPYPYVKIWDTF